MTYHDRHGNPCDLLTVCREDPEYAARTIATLRRAIARIALGHCDECEVLFTELLANKAEQVEGANDG